MNNDKLDLIKILKNCPRGTKLYSPIVGELIFYGVDKDSNYPIQCVFSESQSLLFTLDGRYFFEEKYGECMLFPSKENRDWSTFTIFKDGDILTVESTDTSFIFTGKYNCYHHPIAYGGVISGRFVKGSSSAMSWTSKTYRHATDKEAADMFKIMETSGYVWDSGKKKLYQDLPIDSWVAVSNIFSGIPRIPQMGIRRYAGKGECFKGSINSKTNGITCRWKYVISLDDLKVNNDNFLDLENVTNYGTNSVF